METVNVNLQKCECPPQLDEDHFPECQAVPVLIPAPSRARSVAMTVRLGECAASCSAAGRAALTGGRSRDHYADCPACHINVTCTIGGEAWAESEVIAVDGVATAFPKGLPVEHACRARWEIVKALVTGSHSLASTQGLDLKWLDQIFAQRDAMFLALADMARAEQDAFRAQDRALSALQDPLLLAPYHDELPENRPSARMLERCVERVLRQVMTFGEGA